MNANTSYHTPDAFSIPSIVIGLPDGASLEVSWITFKCISVFEHRDGSTTQVRGDMALVTFLSQLIAPEPEPSAPIAFPIRLIQTSVAAAQEPRMATNVIRIAATTRGEIYSNVSVEEAARRFAAKYQTPVTRIRVNRFDQTIDNYNGIEIERSKSVLPGQIWVGA